MKELVAKVLIATLIVLFLINFTAAKVYKLSVFEVEIDLNLSTHPQTIIDFPPIGEIRAATHKAPVDLNLTLAAIHQDRLSQIINNMGSKDELITLLKARSKVIIQLFIIRLLVISVLGGIIGASIVVYNRQSIIAGLLVGITIIAILTLSTYYTYEISKFNDPNFEGMLEAAPWMIGLIQEGLNSLDQLGYEMQLIASNMSELFSKVDTLRPLSRVTGDLKVLHITDIHNNPVALPYIEEIVKSFGVDFIIDTGDITDYGTPLEGELLKKINDLKVPYVFIAGNHDSPDIVDKMSSFENVVVIQADVINIKGLVIAGVEDPAAKTNQIKPVDEEDVVNYKEGLEELVERLKLPPDIVITHNFTVGKDLTGRIPLLLHGHDHAFKIYKMKGTTVIDAGTTGAAGIRGLESEEGIPYSVALLHYNNLKEEERERWSLDVVDIIKFYDRHSGFILERQLINSRNSKKAKAEE
ncbi:metallophosphoesterase family protein [Orenia marismortui]|uniref:metallophosphoesterase family protein n=1 Tax=Orenia marismortui TaxID=46469 RepID=UPI00036E2CC8|nr:metallophosphoesterase [Orenia marismortui]